MATDYRSRLSAAEFEAIPADEDYPIDGYYDKLIACNDKFRGLDDKYPGGFTDMGLMPHLTDGQRLLIFLGGFDGEVKNGGVTQFFWNCPDRLFEVRDGIELLGPTELLRNYDVALEALIGKKDRWNDLRQECYKDKNNPQWEPFRQTYELLSLDWFDTAYFDKRGYNDQKQWVIQERGLNHALLTRLARYVRSHRAEFIEE